MSTGTLELSLEDMLLKRLWRWKSLRAVVLWPNPDPIQHLKEFNPYTMVLNQTVSFIAPDGLRKFPYGAGKICTSKSCNPERCIGKFLHEDYWGAGFLDLPEPGKCMSADAVAMPNGDYWKIPDNCRVTVECYTTDRWREDGTTQKGKFKTLRYTCYGLATPRPTPAPVPPFPPSPY